MVALKFVDLPVTMLPDTKSEEVLFTTMGYTYARVMAAEENFTLNGAIL
jgi:hypothetical protein